MNKPFYHTVKFWILIISLSILLGTTAVIARIFDHSGNASHNIARLWCRLLCQWNGVKVKITGLEHILTDQPQIFVSNHQGYFDIFALSGFLPVQIRWVAKSSLFKIPFMGWAMSAAGYIPVERNNRKQSYQAFLSTLEAIKAGSSVVVFPEGTRSEDGNIGVFKKGSQLLAQRAKVPMVPVTIIGTRDIIRKGSMLINPKAVRIIISPCINLEGEDAKKGDERLQEIRNIICENFKAT